jgi:hypothetical protein
MARECKVIVAVGKKGVGKTVATIEMIYKYVKGNPLKGVPPRKALIFDVNDEFSSFWFHGQTHSIKPLAIKDIPLFSVHPSIEVRRIRPFWDDGKKMSIDDMASVLGIILENYRNGLLLVEDINKYSSDTPKKDLVSALATVRHIGIDLIAHYQSVGRPANPKLLGNISMIRMHKTNDSVARHKGKFEDKTEILMIAESIVSNRYNTGDKRYYVYVDVDDSKILSAKEPFLDSEIDAAIEDYISKNHSNLIKPLLNKINLTTGKKIHTPATAIQAVRADLKGKYFT